MDKRELEQSAFQEVTSSRGFVHECARILSSREKLESRTIDAEVESVVFRLHPIPLPPWFNCLICAFLSRCPNSDGDDSRAPALCLVCGAMLCSQSYCCQTEVEGGEKVGACAAHAQKCGAGVGVFLRVRECHILLMANKNKGCFYSPPYLDAYGETDQGLR